jgi:hypothetical protein
VRSEGLNVVVPQRIVSLVPSLTEALCAFGWDTGPPACRVFRRPGERGGALWFLRWLAEVVEVPRVEVVLGLIELYYARAVRAVVSS